MFIAHPATGYLLGRWLHKRGHNHRVPRSTFIAWATAGAVVPDLDLLWFALFGEGDYLQQSYFSHWPLSWLLLLMLARFWAFATPTAPGSIYLQIFAINGLVHLLLDTWALGVRWLAPMREDAFALLTIPDEHDAWWLNFLLHPTVLLEVMILGLAILVWRFRPYRQEWY